MIKRDIEIKLKEIANQLPIVAVIGPRQSGKTTLVREIFSNHKYISLENLDIREIAIKDPRQFLQAYKNPHGIILDEFQNAPEILSYIQTYVDNEKLKGYFILTGSQNFLVNEAISQTLAGRIGILTLLPLSINELKNASILPENANDLIFKGSYPRLYDDNISVKVFYDSYTLTYVERDVRQIINIENLSTFKRFVQLCAGRIGQLLNISSLAADCSISQLTAKSWISLLEASYIIFLLQPHYKNFSKRIVKSPKLYFYDTGLACSLLAIESPEQLLTHYLTGNLFECLIISELQKKFYNSARLPRVYFWRDNHGHEIDCLIEKALGLIPIEIKSGKTLNSSFFEGLKFYKSLAKSESEKPYLVYSGDENLPLIDWTILGWKEIDKIDF